MSASNSNGERVQLQKRVDRDRARLWKLEEKERQATNLKFVGKCFKYRNCYSCPTKPSDYWWLYRKVLAVDAQGWLKVFQFQVDKYGKISVEPEERCMNAELLGQSITLKQFRHAWKITVRGVNYRAGEAGAVA